MDFGTIWAELGMEENQKTLVWAGAAVVAIGGALWKAYKTMIEKEQAATPITQHDQHNSGQQVNIGQVSGGNVSINQQSEKS